MTDDIREIVERLRTRAPGWQSAALDNEAADVIERQADSIEKYKTTLTNLNSETIKLVRRIEELEDGLRKAAEPNPADEDRPSLARVQRIANHLLSPKAAP